MYRSNDTGRTWTHLGLDETQMIAYVDCRSGQSRAALVAALGHPYGPNAERGVYIARPTAGRTFAKVLYKDEYTSANEVRIDPSNPGTVYAALWQQQSTFYEYAAFGLTRRGRARAGSTSPPTAARLGRSSRADCHRCSRRTSRSRRAIRR